MHNLLFWLGRNEVLQMSLCSGIGVMKTVCIFIFSQVFHIFEFRDVQCLPGESCLVFRRKWKKKKKRARRLEDHVYMLVDDDIHRMVFQQLVENTNVFSFSGTTSRVNRNKKWFVFSLLQIVKYCWGQWDGQLHITRFWTEASQDVSVWCRVSLLGVGEKNRFFNASRFGLERFWINY